MDEQLEKYFKRIEAACGIPDAAEGCRVILKLVAEARRVLGKFELPDDSLLKMSKRDLEDKARESAERLIKRIELSRMLDDL